MPRGRRRRDNHPSRSGDPDAQHPQPQGPLAEGQDAIASGAARERNKQQQREANNINRIRDYYTLEDDSGARYWVFRAGLYQREAEDGAPVWYMHGLFG